MKMKDVIIQSLLVLLLSNCFASISTSVAHREHHRSDHPNIVILFADNLGYNDIGTFRSGSGSGSKKDYSPSPYPPPSSSSSSSSHTPNIDSLARDGMKFHNWNSAAHLCSASRAALLTGRYPVRSGVYPAVFKPDAVNGLRPEEVTIAEYLKMMDVNIDEREGNVDFDFGYATSIVGKWHLGHRPEYLPTSQGFDSWLGVPYHMSGGSTDGHVCGFDTNATMWLPLFNGTEIIEQPVDVRTLAEKYAEAAEDFMEQSVDNGNGRPFLLYLPFSHVHQLCAPQQDACQWAGPAFTSPSTGNATFDDAVEEMDWIAGKVLDKIDDLQITNDTIVIFTSDNGPWVAEQSCSGSKGPFDGKWLQYNVDEKCTACPHDYVPSPTAERPRRCVFPGKEEVFNLDGVHCGDDTGLGGVWESNLRMPALVRWPGKIEAGSETMEMVSTLDVLPTILSIVGIDPASANLDGVDISNILFQSRRDRNEHENKKTKRIDEELLQDRILFFWRDGFKNGPLPQPFGRFDVVAAKLGKIKAWFYTKSAHYNADEEVFHDPPLLFNVIDDPAEAYPLNPDDYEDIIQEVKRRVAEHKLTVDWVTPLTVARDPKYIPCVDKRTNCRTHAYEYEEEYTQILDGNKVSSSTE